MKKLKNFPVAEEVFLENAPLVRVLAQIRFEQILSIQSQASVAPFQDAIRKEYPVLRIERRQTMMNAPDGAMNVSQATTWRFCDISDKWKVSLAPDFIAIETSAYTSRKEFLDKFGQILAAFTEHLKPGVITRVGIRYIDRLTGDALAIIPKLVRSELLGVMSDSFEIPVEATASEAMFKLDENQIFTRWGLLPPDSTIDPRVLEPIDKDSWVLDIDSSNSTAAPWELKQLDQKLNELASTSYNFFRWAVRDDFLDFYGRKK